MKKFKKALLSLLAVAMLFAGANLTGIGVDTAYASNVVGEQFRRNSEFEVIANAYARLDPRGPNLNGLVLARATFIRSPDAAVRHNGWTWVRGTVRGTTPHSGRVVWVATSQLRLLSGGTVITCEINANAYVRNAPDGPNLNNGARVRAGARFRPLGDATVSHNGWTWRLGMITSDNNLDGTNWSNRVKWVATSQFASTSPCR